MKTVICPFLNFSSLLDCSVSDLQHMIFLSYLFNCIDLYLKYNYLYLKSLFHI